MILTILLWWLSGKEPTCQCRRCEFNSWVGKIPWRRKWQPNQCSCLWNPMDRRAWGAVVHGVAKNLDVTLVTKQILLLPWTLVVQSLSHMTLLPHDLQHTRLPCPSYFLECAQTHVHWADDAIHPSLPLSPPSPPALNLSQHQGLFQWVDSLHQVAKVLELPLQHQSFQWIFRTDFLELYISSFDI